MKNATADITAAGKRGQAGSRALASRNPGPVLLTLAPSIVVLEIVSRTQ